MINVIWIVVASITLAVALVFGITMSFGAGFIPSRRSEIREVFKKLKPLTEKDVVVDFGCGDGTVLREAVQSGAGRAVGIELNPLLVALARAKNRGNQKIQVKYGNMTKVKLPDDMTVAYIFGLEKVMKALRPTLERYAQEHHRDIWALSLAFKFEGMRPIRAHGGYRLYKIGQNKS
jgi:SAM-dependent methyltransferase